MINLVVRVNGVKFSFYTGISIDKSDWNSKAGEVRRSSKVCKEANAALDRIKTEAERIILDSMGAGFSKVKLKTALSAFIRGGSNESKDETKTVSQYAAKVLRERLEVGEIRKSTYKGHKSAILALDRFKKGLTFSDIDMEFHREFTKFLLREKKSPNTIANIIKRVKNIMNHAVDSGATTNRSFQSRKFSAQTAESDTVYLTAFEVELIENVDLSAKGLSGERNARNLFLLGVYTGLRYSDFSEITEADIHIHSGVRMIRRRMKKTNRIVAAPLNDKGHEILKYYGSKPIHMSNQKLNKYIKHVCQLAGVSGMVKIDQVRGGVRETKMLPKWSLVSTHTARRTFATLEYIKCVEAGRDYEPIMNIIGHKSRVTFLKYVKVSAEERAAAFVNSIKAV